MTLLKCNELAMKIQTGSVIRARKAVNGYPSKEQLVPKIRSNGSVDDSSNSSPSSPGSSSNIAEEVFGDSFSPFRASPDGNANAALDISSLRNSSSPQPEPPMAQVNGFPKASVNGKRKQKDANPALLNGKKPSKLKENGVQSSRKESELVASSSSSGLVTGDRFSQAASEALHFLMPLIDKLPPDVAFSEDTLVDVRSEQFSSFCATQEIRNPSHLLPSRVVEQLESFYSNSTARNQNNGGFKRPQSPQRTQNDKKKRGNQPQQPAEAAGRASTADELKERMQAKLKAFRAKRKALLEPEDFAEMQELSRKLRRLKKKQKQAQKKHNKKAINTSAQSTGDNTPSGSRTPSSQRSSSVVSDNGKMIFSKFDFFGDESTKPHPKQMKGKNLTHLLNKTEADKRKMEELEQKDPEKAAEVAEKKAWQEALLKAQGVKLKNDPVKLKHALKEQKKRKEKSKKIWDQRNQMVEKQKKEKQEKRNKNIDARKQTVKDKKRKKAIKKGHIIPGFN